MRAQSPHGPSRPLRPRPPLALAAMGEDLTPMQMAEQFGFERHQRALTCQIYSVGPVA